MSYPVRNLILPCLLFQATQLETILRRTFCCDAWSTHHNNEPSIPANLFAFSEGTKYSTWGGE